MNEIKKQYIALGISENVYDYCEDKWNACRDRFKEIDDT